MGVLQVTTRGQFRPRIRLSLSSATRRCDWGVWVNFTKSLANVHQQGNNLHTHSRKGERRTAKPTSFLWGNLRACKRQVDEHGGSSSTTESLLRVTGWEHWCPSRRAICGVAETRRWDSKLSILICKVVPFRSLGRIGSSSSCPWAAVHGVCGATRARNTRTPFLVRAVAPLEPIEGLINSYLIRPSPMLPRCRSVQSCFFPRRRRRRASDR